MSDTESAWRNGQSDANQNRNPANTTGWNSSERDAYDAAFKRQQEENAKRNQ